MIRLAGVFAHPDDDIYLLGGTLLLHRGEIDLSLLFATSGEAGPISDPALAARATLGGLREREQRAGLAAIGYSDARVDHLRHPDYYLPDVSLTQLSGDIEEWLRATRPHVVVTFGPDGLTSHHDHVRVGEAATAAFDRARVGEPDDQAFSRLYHVALARADVDRFYAGVAAGGFEYGEEGRLFDVTGVPDEQVAVRADIRSVADRKWAAILAHRTQMIEHERIPEPLRWIYLDTECFVRVHPPRRPEEPVCPDLLEDCARPARPRSTRSGQP
jgi:LmbE family N-acetylglucosaminyl deacetylase